MILGNVIFIGGLNIHRVSGSNNNVDFSNNLLCFLNKLSMFDWYPIRGVEGLKPLVVLIR